MTDTPHDHTHSHDDPHGGASPGTSWWGVWRYTRGAERDDEHLPNNRLEAFSDGVIAIAITLLILDIRVPKLHNGDARELLVALAQQWPSYVGYVLSFLSIGVIWANHTQMLRYIRRNNHTLLGLNSLFLLTVALLPFATAFLAEYITGTHAEQQVAALVYGGAIALVAVMFNVVWWYGVNHPGLLDAGASSRLCLAVAGQYQLSLVIYLASLVVAFLLPIAAVLIWLVVALYYALPGVGRTA